MFGQHIDTAPVLEAFAQGGECPLCALRDSTETGYLDQFLGGSVMEPNMRVLVNAMGFCGRHFRQLYEANNHLGVALMAHSHMKQTIAALEKRWSAAPSVKHVEDIPRGEGQPRQKGGIMRAAMRLFGRHADYKTHAKTCALCERLDATMDRYVKTTVYLWKNEKSFRERFNESKGLCIAHTDAILASTNDGAMRAAVADISLRNLKRVEQELEWFTLKFDYRNNDKPWGNSKDALPRAILKLASRNVIHK